MTFLLQEKRSSSFSHDGGCGTALVAIVVCLLVLFSTLGGISGYYAGAVRRRYTLSKASSTMVQAWKAFLMSGFRPSTLSCLLGTAVNVSQ